MPRHFILTPVGSAGDVNPFLWIAHGLRARGQAVTLILTPPFDELARAAGLPVVTVGTLADYERLVRDPDLWHAGRAMNLILGHAGRATETQFEAIAAAADRAGHDDVVLAGSLLALGARLAREKFGWPLATIHLQPSVFLSVHETPVLRAHLEGFARLPRWLKRLCFALPNPLDQAAGPAVRAACARAGVPPPRSLMREWMHSPDAVLGLFPAWFGPPQPDWPPRCRLAGFPLYDRGERPELAPEVERFLAAGPPPVLFTPGSAMAHGHEFFAAALAACDRLGARAILATAHREQLPARLPATALAVDYAPFSRLLPRVAAVGHHGGIGTLSQALAAGVPQLVMPMAHDQPDNAQRLVRLGVAVRLYPRRFTAARVAAALDHLRRDAAVRAACTAAAERVRADRPAEVVFDTLETLRRAA
ncbi:MAG TPA: nucleotide disphospho-sugar-binding domain-containing protein [Opitutaceae bacterium]|nr:nucleotide disphospho-sugar-binding domain-containing protein [Opitutaceae bacterium]